MIKIACVVALLLCGCGDFQQVDTAQRARASEFAKFETEDRVVKQVLANGLIELTERVMLLEKRQGRRLKRSQLEAKQQNG